ncbi:hypothetical protein GCM10022404_14930 [Celeribacter arenosi]|uniref:Uncharacterized protein n=1 Tax=Celeribacter arenosi TaxID=792649 RepID=A0ABP7K663_9RHOB
MEGRYKVAYGELDLFWNDFLKISKLHKASFPQEAGESIYMFGATASNVRITMPDGQQMSSDKECKMASSHSVNGRPVFDGKYYTECDRRLRAAMGAVRKPAAGDLIALAKTAVEADGRCQWIGYDRALDLRVRATGRLASFSDDRFFFAKLKCVQ